MYEEDSVPRGMAAFYATENWAYSSTGDFLGNDSALYVVRSTSAINSYDTTELYATARTAPLSLKYYGLCLQEGNYTVGLHFAEIIFTNHSAYTSLGQRRFDVYIQVTDMLHTSLNTLKTYDSLCVVSFVVFQFQNAKTSLLKEICIKISNSSGPDTRFTFGREFTSNHSDVFELLKELIFFVKN